MVKIAANAKIHDCHQLPPPVRQLAPMMTRARAAAEAPHKAAVKEKKSLVTQAYEYVVGGSSSDKSHASASAHRKQAKKYHPRGPPTVTTVDEDNSL